MKTILCYGDSNTWGYDPASAGRFARDARWPGVLQKELGPEFYVIEEGLNGRTTVWDDPIEEHKNGKTYLPPCLQTHKPIDLVIVMLGTNDLKKRFSLAPYDIASGAGTLVQHILVNKAGPNEGAPKVLLIAPAGVGPLSGDFAEMFEGAQDKAPRLGAHYKRVADEWGCAFLNAAEFLTTSPKDGIHLEASEHAVLGQRVARLVKSMMS